MPGQLVKKSATGSRGPSRPKSAQARADDAEERVRDLEAQNAALREEHEAQVAALREKDKEQIAIIDEYREMVDQNAGLSPLQLVRQLAESAMQRLLKALVELLNMLLDVLMLFEIFAVDSNLGYTSLTFLLVMLLGRARIAAGMWPDVEDGKRWVFLVFALRLWEGGVCCVALA